MKRDKLRIGVITTALVMMIAGGVLTWQQDERIEKQKLAEQSQTAGVEETGQTEQEKRTEETAGEADGERAVQEQREDQQTEQKYGMETACEDEEIGQNLPEEGRNASANGETVEGQRETDQEAEKKTEETMGTASGENSGEVQEEKTEAGAEDKGSAGNGQENAVETAGTAQNLIFNEATVMEQPVEGTVLIPYNMENTVYFPTLDLYQCNPGVVFSAAEGTPVLAAADGEVVSVENDARTGLTVTMNLGNGYEAIYGQLADVSLEAGQQVQKAARIGVVAAPTKYYSKEGSNLFFEMKKDGKAIDPMVYLPSVSE